MGALFSRNKSDGKKRTFKFWPSSHDQLNSSKGKGVNSPMNISKSQPITSQQQQWTEVSLAPPSSVLDNIEKDLVIDVPVPPPRKHKSKTIKPIIEKIVVEKSSTKVEAVDGGTPTKLIPVEEDIIIPKKEPVHICDGTHHHVTNVVNGKIIHDTIVTPKKNEAVEKKNIPIQQTPKKEEKVIIRPKNLSTVSLPNFDELKVASVSHKHSSKESKKKPKRHISVVSLPTHNKTTLSDATIARLENYMARCKSFGSLPPKELLEKLQSQLDFSSDSEESWEGIDDWDLEILEYTGVKQSPLIPRSRLTFPQTTITTTTTTSTSRITEPSNKDNISDVPHVDVHHAPDIHAVETIQTSHTYSQYPHSDIRVPTTIEEDDEFVKAVPQGIITLKKREGRRESIDDFFDSKAENPLVKFAKSTPDNYLGRRGSDGFFGNDDRENILKDLSKKTGSFYSQSMLESESNHTKMVQRRKSAGDALHRIDSMEYNDEDDDQDKISKENSTISEKSNSESNDTNKDSKRDSLNDNDDFVLVHKDISKSETTENKPEVSEHSNLLKFLKTDITEESTEVKHNK